MAITQKWKITSLRGDRDKSEPLYMHCGGACEMVWLVLEIVWWFLKKLNIELPYNPMTPFLRIYLKELKASSQTDMCTHMFIAAFFTTVKKMETTEMVIN
jgi:hypothetical protein